jgi:CRP-like cAMP-binding protein
VIQVVSDALSAAPIERVATEPKPSVICYDFAKDGRDSFAYYAVRYWLLDLAVDDPTSSVVRTRIYHALRRAGIPLALPASKLLMKMDDEATAVSRHRPQRIDAVRSMSLFKPLTDDEVAELSDHLRYAPFTAGETMTKQGAVAHWLYIIIKGTADVRATVDGASKTVAHLEAPAFFGEMGMMTGEKRTADVVATSEVECYRLDKEGFQAILKNRPEVAEQMSDVLAVRRVGLDAVREGLDAEARRAREEAMKTQILLKIEDFFGLRSTSIPPKPPR